MFDMQIERHEGKGRILTAKFETFYLVSVYVPNSSFQNKYGANSPEGIKNIHYRLNEWDFDFYLYLKALDKNKPIVLGGDLNVFH